MTKPEGVAVWLAAPLNTLPARLRWLLVVGVSLGTGLGSWAVERTLLSPFAVPDAAHYVALAQGRIAEVGQPFASRPLAPLIVRGLTAATGWRVETGFTLLGAISMACLLLGVFGLATRTAAPRWSLPFLGAALFWPLLLQSLALPDLPYAALLCLFLLCLFVERYTLAAFLLFPLMLARESTLLVLLCLLAVAWRSLRVRGCLLAVAAAAAGGVAVKHLSAGAAGNVEGLPPALYMLAKLPWNLLRTLGVDPWSNLYPFLCGTPVRRYALHLGPLRSVGMCRFSPQSPTGAAGTLLTLFGLLPLCVAVLWPRRRHWASLPPAVRFCLLYGGISFVLAPALGTAYPRLFGYSWPLFLVGLPALWGAARRRLPVPALGALLGLHAALAWVGIPRMAPVSLGWAVALQGSAILFWLSLRSRIEPAFQPG